MIENISELLEALTKAAWPILAFVLVWRFHDEVGLILRRVAEFKKGKLFGQEVEMEDSLSHLQTAALEVKEKVDATPPEQGDIRALMQENIGNDKYILEAARSPRAALMLLAADIEREARVALARVGKLNGRTSVPLDIAINEISTHFAGGLTADVVGLLGQFRVVRNSIVHGHMAVSDNDIFRTIDSGITLLNALRAVPSEKHVVKHPYLPVYSDESCTKVLSGVGGLMIESESPGTSKKFDRVFPTTRHTYVKGQVLSWEWNFHRRFADAWYKHPETGEPILAWNQAMEFAGRPLDQV